MAEYLHILFRDPTLLPPCVLEIDGPDSFLAWEGFVEVLCTNDEVVYFPKQDILRMILSNKEVE